MSLSPRIPADRIVVLMPTWLGDAVMATPFLRALAGRYPHARLAAVARPLAAPVLAGLPYIHEVHQADRANAAATHRWLRAGKFDLGIALPNAFRAAWTLFRARIPARLGYARDGRTFLLTHTLDPARRTPEQRRADDRKAAAIHQISREHGRLVKVKIGSPFQPMPAIAYYLALAEYLGAPEGTDRRMELVVTAQEAQEAESVLEAVGVPSEALLITVVPGANFGSSKCWPPERFGALADALIEKYDAHIAIAGSPAEKELLQTIRTSAKRRERVHAVSQYAQGKGMSLGAVKQLVKRSTLMVCNDTGPRHFAAALNVPTVTLFGPTDPRWAETYHARERIVRIDVPCGPCQLKKCPIDHRCLQGISVGMVLEAAECVLR
ncbi:MAG TPA: glycosyltransferase family 9 protein [Phycisphaerae bacterium]|nr:glycosyltransferase family 9 protein [Phycisphaerae bacterium]